MSELWASATWMMEPSTNLVCCHDVDMCVNGVGWLVRLRSGVGVHERDLGECLVSGGVRSNDDDAHVHRFLLEGVSEVNLTCIPPPV